MKTNLDSTYKTNTNEEVEGVWCQINDKVRFQLRRYGGANAQNLLAASAKYKKPFARQIETNTLDPKKAIELNVKIFVETSLVTWEGVQTEVEVDGKKEMKDLPYTKENAISLLIALPDLLTTLFQFAMDSGNYREDLGNS